MESRFAMTLFGWAKPKLALRCDNGLNTLCRDDGDVDYDRLAVAVKDVRVDRCVRLEEHEYSGIWSRAVRENIARYVPCSITAFSS